MSRISVTLTDDQLLLAEEYAKATHRTRAELIVEALFQIRHRYPRRAEKRTQNSLEDRLAILEARDAQRYVPQHYGGRAGGVADAV